MEFPEKLRSLAESKGWSLAEVARRAKLKPSTVNSWTTTEARPSLPHARRLAIVLGVSLDFLADDGQDEPSESTPDEMAIIRAARAIGYDEALRRLLLADHSTKAIEGRDRVVSITDMTEMQRRIEAPARAKQGKSGLRPNRDDEGSKPEKGPAGVRRK
jgi:transcriptional regulator with XRE-family HTH domain